MTLVVGLSLMLAVWLLMLLLLRILDAHDEKILLLALLYAIACALITVPILIYSYYAMYQQIEREFHKLRIAQLALSVAVLIPTVFGLVILVKIAPLLSPPG
jgi:hypothetical protein